MKLTLIFSLIFLSLNTFAGLTEDFDRIKTLGRNLEPVGAICEEVAQLRFAEMYPEPQYQVITGVEYADKEKTLGELDVVVFNNESKLIDVVGEVKCYTTVYSGLKKAKEQRKRFLTSVQQPQALRFKWLGHPELPLLKPQFKKVKKFFSIGQRGTLAKGFDYELPYSLAELMQLRDDIRRCQTEGLCSSVK